jgi:hypothetical protein
LQQFDLRTRKPRVVDADAPPGAVFFVGNELHVLGNGWWKKRPSDSRFQAVTKNIPWSDSGLNLSWGSRFEKRDDAPPPKHLYQLRGFSLSAHYGVVAGVYRGMNSVGRTYYHLHVPIAPKEVSGRP